MVPLQAVRILSERGAAISTKRYGLTKLLLDDLKYLLLVKFFRQSLDSSQGLTTIAFCASSSQPPLHQAVFDAVTGCFEVIVHTLDPNMDVILRLLCFASVFVGLGEGVYDAGPVSFVP